MNYDDVTIHPGELHVAETPSRIRTLLGSCVAVTLHNRKQRVGGMNHYMLPRTLRDGKDGEDYRFGDVSIRAMVRRMLDRDPDRDHLEAKLFGGGEVVSSLAGAGIGQKNIDLARAILREYGIPTASEYVGNRFGLKLIFNTYTGVVQAKRIPRRDDRTRKLSRRERSIVNKLPDVPDRPGDRGS